MKDEALIQLLNGPDRKKAFLRLYRYFPVIKKYVLQNSGSKADAEDLFQDSILALYQNSMKSEFKLTSSLETYLFSIAKNLWLNRLRLKAKSNIQNTLIINETENPSIQKETQLTLAERAIQLISEQCNRILEMFYFQKKSMEDIAHALSYSSVNAAKTAKYKCIEKAKTEYNQLLKTENQ